MEQPVLRPGPCTLAISTPSHTLHPLPVTSPPHFSRPTRSTPCPSPLPFLTFSPPLTLFRPLPWLRFSPPSPTPPLSSLTPASPVPTLPSPFPCHRSVSHPRPPPLPLPFLACLTCPRPPIWLPHGPPPLSYFSGGTIQNVPFARGVGGVRHGQSRQDTLASHVRTGDRTYGAGANPRTPKRCVTPISFPEPQHEGHVQVARRDSSPAPLFLFPLSCPGCPSLPALLHPLPSLASAPCPRLPAPHSPPSSPVPIPDPIPFPVPSCHSPSVRSMTPHPPSHASSRSVPRCGSVPRRPPPPARPHIPSHEQGRNNGL